MKEALKYEQEALDYLLQLKVQENVTHILELQTTAIKFTKEAINNITRGPTEANKTVIMKAKEFQWNALEEVNNLGNGRETQIKRELDAEMAQEDAVNVLVELYNNITNLHRDEIVKKMKEALTYEQEALDYLLQLKDIIKEDNPVNYGSALVSPLSVDEVVTKMKIAQKYGQYRKHFITFRNLKG